MVLLGIGVVTWMPLGMFWASKHHWTCELLGNPHCYPVSTGCWEVAAMLWSAIYILLFLGFVAGDVLSANTKAGWALKWTLASVFFLVIEYFIFVGRWNPFPIPDSRLVAETLMIAYFFLTDLWWGQTKKVRENFRGEFMEIFRTVDTPGLVGFAGLVVYDYYFGSPELLPFIAGAAAMNLIVVNTAFTLSIFLPTEPKVT